MIPENLKYTDTHEWVRVESGVATTGITNYAQEQLSDIVFVELPKVGARVSKGTECGVIESSKIASDLYAPITGTVTEVNEELGDHPEYVNQEPYDKGWMMKIEISDSSELEQLMDAQAYRNYLEQLD